MTGAARRARPRLPVARLPEAAAQLHLVGEPQGLRGQPPLRRRLPRPRQHRRLRPLAAAARRRPPRAGRRHRLDGLLLRARCSRWRSSWRSDDPAYEDMASKFFEHFVAIADAMNTLGGTGLWDEEDGFYYDQLHVDGRQIPLRVRSLVGLIPLLRRRGARRGAARPRCPASPSACTGSSRTARTCAARSPMPSPARD